MITVGANQGGKSTREYHHQPFNPDPNFHSNHQKYVDVGNNVKQSVNYNGGVKPNPRLSNGIPDPNSYDNNHIITNGTSTSNDGCNQDDNLSSYELDVDHWSLNVTEVVVTLDNDEAIEIRGGSDHGEFPYLGESLGGLPEGSVVLEIQACV